MGGRAEQQGFQALEHTIHVEGPLDGLVARRLETLILGASPGERIRIDLSLTVEANDFVIAVLAEALNRSRATVELHGLGPHRLAALARLGVDISALQRALH
ncbi:MAG: hypothetical protein QM767_13110 [Anaeromyxobacter sp.]